MSGTASMSTEQFREFAGVVIRSLPDDLPPAVAQKWIGNSAELRKALRETLCPQTASTFSRDMAAEANWNLVEDIPDDPVPASQLELVSFLKRGENYVKGEEMRKRAKKANASPGQRQAEYLLEHQEEIPKEWQDFSLTFPGTLWRDRRGHLDVPYLHWDGGRWRLYFRWLEDDWYSDGLLVRRK